MTVKNIVVTDDNGSTGTDRDTPSSSGGSSGGGIPVDDSSDGGDLLVFSDGVVAPMWDLGINAFDSAIGWVNVMKTVAQAAQALTGRLSLMLSAAMYSRCPILLPARQRDCLSKLAPQLTCRITPTVPFSLISKWLAVTAKSL